MLGGVAEITFCSGPGYRPQSGLGYGGCGSETRSEYVSRFSPTFTSFLIKELFVTVLTHGRCVVVFSVVAHYFVLVLENVGTG